MTRQVRLWKGGKKVRKSLGQAGWIVKRVEREAQAWHTLCTGCQVKLKGATLVEAHLVQNRHFVRRKVVVFRSKIADLLRDIDGRAIRGRHPPSCHRQSQWEISRCPQSQALP